MTNYTTLGGKVECVQCRATSKRTKKRCGNPAMKGKKVCRHHGGLSRGASPEGRAKIAKAHTVHGRETRAKRKERSIKLAEIRCLEELAHQSGMYPRGTPRTRGRKPIAFFGESDEVEYLKTLSVPERQEAIVERLREIITSDTKSMS